MEAVPSGNGSSFDAIVIGGGPNGLMASSYLARAGARVLLLERRIETGGGLNTDEYFGFRFNLHAIYHMMADVMPAFKDLDLENFGLRYVSPPQGAAFILPDSSTMLFSNDPVATAEEIAKFSSMDANRYRTMWDDFQPMLDHYLVPLTYELPMGPLEQLELMEQDEVGRDMARISEMSFVDILDDYGFEDPSVRMALLSFPAMWGLDLHEPLGFLYPLYLCRMLNASIVKGGSHRMSSAIYRSFVQAGGVVRDSCPVTRIIMEGGAASGVETANGETFQAPLVISTLNPEQTFIELVGSDHLDDALRSAVDAWEWEERSLFGLHLGIQGDLSYKTSDPRTADAMVAFMGLATEDDLHAHLARVDASESGSAEWIHVTVPTRFDSTQAPGGYQTVRIESISSYGMPWEKITSSYAESCLEMLSNYADFGEITVQRACPPTYIEQRLTTMKHGSIKHGAYTPLQLGYFRPNDLCSRIETPIPGLLVAGASVYPGGMILGGPGYLGAKVAMEMLGLGT
ncbi:MAG: phytoene desaturase family protein [Acidimicrobiales bacterium]